MEKTYNPQSIEQALYRVWEEKGYFKPHGDESQGNYCIMIPPPNVTGSCIWDTPSRIPLWTP